MLWIVEVQAGWGSVDAGEETGGGPEMAVAVLVLVLGWVHPRRTCKE